MFSFMRFSLMLCCLAFVLAACGGGGGNGGGEMAMPPMDPLPVEEPETEEEETTEEPEMEEEQMPDMTPLEPPISSLPSPRVPDTQTYYRGDRDTVATYLQDVFETDAILRFSGQPRLRLGSSHYTGSYLSQVQAAVEELNAALPAGNQIQFDPQAPVTSEAQAGDIVLRVDETCLLCVAGTTAVVPNLASRATEIVISHFTFDPDHPSGCASCLTDLLLHELLHAMGLWGHVSERFTSALNPPGLTKRTTLPSADRDGLAAIYTLEDGDRATDLGPWAVRNHSLEGSFNSFAVGGGVFGQGLAFGVKLQDGQIQAYVSGPEATGALSGSGTATWGGTLFGFTPDQTPVSGGAHLSVNLADLTGRADFTSLETWAGAPGTPGTGTLWGDGRLGYQIAVTGNTFTQTAGDDGALHGKFFGSGHRGAGGTLVRDDLTAAFGARR